MEETVTRHARPDAELLPWPPLTAEGLIEVYDRVEEEDLVLARVHQGDATLFGRVREEIRYAEYRGLRWELVPGVSSLTAAAAAIRRELTGPESAQSLILARTGGRTPVPEGQRVADYARHGATMALFVSADEPHEVQRDLIEGGYPPDTPCAAIQRASWPDERVVRCRLDELGDRLSAEEIDRQTLILVGPELALDRARGGTM
jgi:precorrin-4/cobalt-precorrin-4 C11-methyltransferase